MKGGDKLCINLRGVRMRKLPIIDLFLSIISIWWAICLFSNQHMFDHVPNLFRVFANISQEDGWGLYFLVAAFVKVIAIVTENIKLRKIVTKSVFSQRY